MKRQRSLEVTLTLDQMDKLERAVERKRLSLESVKGAGYDWPTDFDLMLSLLALKGLNCLRKHKQD